MSNLNNELSENNRKDPTIDEPLEGHGSEDTVTTEAEVTASDISDVTEASSDSKNIDSSEDIADNSENEAVDDAVAEDAAADEDAAAGDADEDAVNKAADEDAADEPAEEETAGETEKETAAQGVAGETAAEEAAAGETAKEAAASSPAADTSDDNTEQQADDEKKAKRKKILKICGGVAAAILVVYCLIALTYRSKFTTGTIINGIDASGMTIDEYTDALTEKVESYVLTMKFRNKKSEKIVGTDIGYTYIKDDGAENLLKNQNILAWARGYFGVTKEYTVDEGCKFDEEKMKELATSLPELQFENMEVPTNAHLGVKEDTPEGEALEFEIIPETYGTQLKPDTFSEAIIEAAKAGVQEYDVDEAGLYVEPAIYADDPYLKDSIDGFNDFLSTSVTYDLPNGEQEVLDASVLKNWIAMREDGVQYINEDIVKEHVNAYVALLAMKVDDVHNERILHSTLQGDVSFPTETWGHMINQEEESAALLADIQNHNVVEREPVYSLDSTYAENFGYTYVEVDIENQTCFYYEDGELLWSSECVTGTGSDSSRSTVRGIFSILNKQQGRILRGPQLEDGSYTYESYVNYWMQFYEGYGLHDATWRSSYEFGGDTYWYSGSHGCVNLPYYAAESLYFMVSTGTYVLVF